MLPGHIASKHIVKRSMHFRNKNNFNEQNGRMQSLQSLLVGMNNTVQNPSLKALENFLAYLKRMAATTGIQSRISSNSFRNAFYVLQVDMLLCVLLCQAMSNEQFNRRGFLKSQPKKLLLQEKEELIMYTTCAHRRSSDTSL